MLDFRESAIAVAYIVAAVLFIFGLKHLSSPATARAGNRLAALGMFIALGATLLDRQIVSFWMIAVGTALGAAIGIYFARTVQMTAMPQMVALFNGMGGGTAALVSVAEYLRLTNAGLQIGAGFNGNSVAAANQRRHDFGNESDPALSFNDLLRYTYFHVQVISIDRSRTATACGLYSLGMPRKIHWSELRVGLIAAAVIAVVVLSIMLFARVGALHGKKATLYVLTADATGVLKGTEVWLSGQKIGLVSDVRFRPSSADTAERLVIESEILADRLVPIRRDSHASIGPGTSMIGVPVVFITAGSMTSPGLHDGDTIRAEVSTKILDVGEEMGAAGAAASSLAVEVRGLAGKISDRRGSAGMIISQGMPALSNASGRMSSLMNKATKGNGTLGLMSRGNLGARVSIAMAGVDSIMALASSNRGNVGRFRRDSTLVPKIKGMMAEIDSLRAMASNPVGTIGRAHNDSTLLRLMDKSRASLDSLMKDIKSHPLRYIAF